VVPPAAFLFDLDGTLIDSERLYAHAIARVMADAGAPLTAEEQAFVVGHGWREIHAHLRAEPRVGLSLRALQERTFAATAALRAEGHGFVALPGVHALLELAASWGIPVAIVTGSASEEAAVAVADLGVAAQLAFVVSADDVPRGKPAPDGYLLAAQRLGVAPRDCVVFEDSAAGIAAGLAAGMAVIATAACNPPPGHPAHQDHAGAHLRVAGLDALDDAMIRGLFSGGGAADDPLRSGSPG
jgi:HAD superfamily hydrolase (TIGR01509 family)